jgi:hypothetical protein
MEMKRDLIKASLCTPERKPCPLSYTQAPTSKDDVSVKRTKGKDIQGKRILEFIQDCIPTYTSTQSRNSHLERFHSHFSTHPSFTVESKLKSNRCLPRRGRRRTDRQERLHLLLGAARGWH